VPLDKRQAKALLGYPDCPEKWVLFNALSVKNPIKRCHLAKQAFEIDQARHGSLQLRLATDLPHDMLPLFTASCDVIVCTSENEGWPNSVKEALACNVPFVSTDVSDLRDIARNEPSCRICPPDPRVIAENICDVLKGPEPRNLRQYVLDMSLDAIGEKLVSTYEAVLRRHRQSARLASGSLS
jgi:glycosyltransferase involved in cell wall biosynthesis